VILREPALQLVSHYGQELFAQLWTADRLRFVFEQGEPPDCARDFPVTDEDIDRWALSTLRFIQFQELSVSRRWRLWNAARRKFLRSGGSAAFSGGSRAEARHPLPKRQVECSYFLLSQQSSAIMPKEWYSTDLWTDFGIKFIDDVVARNIRPSSKAKPSCRWKAKSLVPAFANQPIEREAIFWEHEGNAAVRAGDWKLVRLGRKGEWELYNLKTDRTELHNLAAQEPDRNGMRGHCARA
jgi:hypothetical protein